MSAAWFRSVARRFQTRVGQRANLVVGRLVAQPSPHEQPRIAQRVRSLLETLGYREQNYKTCLITEAQCLRAMATYGPPGAAWAGVTMPAARLLIYQLRRNALRPLRIGRRLWQKARPTRRPKQTVSSAAGLFFGMNYRLRSAQDLNKPEPNRFAEITHETKQLLRTFKAIDPSHHGEGKIGILISCYRPEAFVHDFLKNLAELATPERLIPVVINAGMSAECEETFRQSLAEGGFHQYHLLNRPGIGIYEAWNVGIEVLGNTVEFITNFNVDDRRHPLCLNAQAECLNTFPSKQVAITDYCYFFKSEQHTKDLYASNSGNITLIPTVNQRTLIDHNFPHSSPLWRRSLHLPNNVGLFDATYQSAGDAEFWYRVSQMHPNAFKVISIPLSLYYQNPKGLSTRPQTIGVIEHQRCTKDHYNWIVESIDSAASERFTEKHLNIHNSEHLQLYAYISSLNEIHATLASKEESKS